MTDRGRGGWAYLSLVEVLPGRPPATSLALAGQFLVFEAAALGLAAGYDIWAAVPVATVAITISTLGSGLMMRLNDRIRALSPPSRYRRLLFDSSVDVVMGLVAFLFLVTYLLVDARGPGPDALDTLLGSPLPAPAVFLSLVVGWDLAYRIGIGWWASVTGLWRAVVYTDRFDPATKRAFARADGLTIGFAALQLLLVPFLWPVQPLALLVLGHVLAVLAVSGLAIAVGRLR